MKKAGFMKDAFILFAITLISGLLLGAVYQVTKDPIKQAQIEATNRACKTVFADAESFVEEEALKAAVVTCNVDLPAQGFGKVGVDQVFKAMGADGGQLGYVVTAYSMESYGGELKISVGVKEDGTVTGIAFLTISDTPGVGLKVQKEDFKGQFIGKNATSLTVVKGGKAGDAEIDGISGATISSAATTNAVNAALYFIHNCIQE